VTYRAMTFQRFLLPVILVAFAAAAVGVVVATVRGNGPPIAFLVLWLAAFGWNAYWWSLRVCFQVGVDGSTLTWRTALLRRQAPTGDVVRVRPSRWNRQMAVLELQGRRPLMVPVRYGFGELTTAIRAAAPQATVES
jgi:hypothetical protein